MMTEFMSQEIEKKYDKVSKTYPPYKEYIPILSYRMIEYAITFQVT